MEVTATTITQPFVPRHIQSNGHKRIYCNFDGSFTISSNDHDLVLIETITDTPPIKNKKRYNRKPRWENIRKK